MVKYRAMVVESKAGAKREAARPRTSRQEQVEQALEIARASGAQVILKPMDLVRRRALEELQKVIQKGS